MTDRSDVFEVFQLNVQEHVCIARAIARCIASVEETVCRSRETISETRELIASLDKPLAVSRSGGLSPLKKD